MKTTNQLSVIGCQQPITSDRRPASSILERSGKSRRMTGQYPVSSIKHLLICVICVSNLPTALLWQEGLCNLCFSQGILYNYGVNIYIRPNTTLYLYGDTSGYTNLSSATTDGSIDIDGTMIVEGNWTNNAANEVFVNVESVPNGTVIFKGDILQSIDGVSQTTFENLTVLNTSTAGIDVNTQINITGTMLFSDGIVHTTENSVVEFRDNAISTDGAGNAAKDASYIEGPVRKIGDEAFTFPTGDNGFFRPIGISNFDGINQTFTAWYHGNNPDYDGYNVTLTDGEINNVSDCEYWTLERDNGSANTTVTLSWDNSYTCNIPNNPEQFRVARWNGSLWENKGHTGVETTADGGKVHSELINDFSPFTLAELKLIVPVVPNIFSPNDDGQNDDLYVIGSGVRELTFVIYDRWGEKIFETNDISKGWDGTYKGKPLDMAVFVYYLKATMEDDRTIEDKGNVTLIR